MKVQHYDDETIIAFVTGEDENDPTTAIRRRHLTTCPDCADVVDEYRQILEAAGEEAVWDFRELRLEEKPSAQTLTTLRNFVDEMACEDAEAEPRLAELLAGPRETWSSHLAAHPEWRTAGMVRKLIAATDRAIDTMPPDALEITKLAVDIAESLDPTRHVSDTVLKLRGQAWRERAFVHYYVGNFASALTAVDHAQAVFTDCSTAEFEVARLDTLRALVYRALERIPEALALANGSVEVFDRYETTERLISAKFTKAHLLLKANDFRQAFNELTSLRHDFDAVMSDDTRARVTANIAFCLRELREYDSATEEYRLAAQLFDLLDVPTEAAKIRWSVAGILTAAGKTQEAKATLTHCLDEFEQLGMTAAAAHVRLELSELFLAECQYDSVQTLCSDAMKSFEAAGLTYSSRAMAALGYLKEAARNTRATPTLVREVRRYIERLPKEPALLFLPRD